jgi:uncharacterized lipoprotein YbaY
MSMRRLSRGLWAVVLIALLSVAALNSASLADASAESVEAEEAIVTTSEQVPPPPSGPRPAPVQIPGGPAGAQPAASARVTGTVTYRERMALPPNAIVQVSLQDISRADAPATVLGTQQIPTGGRQVPIPYEIAYDPAAIDQRFTYSVRARITVDGQLWFTSTTATLVITRGNPTSDVEIVVQRV